MKRRIAVLVSAAVVSSMLAGTLLALFLPGPQTNVSQRNLTFAERVVYQRAIEEVYWRHRIWPKERPDPKPPLDSVMSQAQLETKVEDCLRDSQALEAYWQKPIAPEQLQAEMERMARNTKQPEVLRELFEALGNDPSVIAECLARPIVAERLVAEFSSGAKDASFRAKSRNPAARLMGNSTGSFDFAQDDAGVNVDETAYTLPKIPVPLGCTEDTWTATSITNAPAARGSHTAVWTGSEMIVWGGYGGSSFNTGGRYDPSTDSWTSTSTANAPSARNGHTAVWTGNEMIVWGGDDGQGLNTGGRYNPATNTWVATSITNAPSGREFHTAIWTGDKMIVWGGDDGSSDLNTGGKYDAGTDTWMATSTTNAPVGRERHTAVWTGSEMIVWGGSSGLPLNTGGRYNPGTNTWTATSTTNVPSLRAGHTAFWTGNEMIVWGGLDDNFNVFNTGGRYNPGTNSWIATSISNAPEGRFSHTAVWTGSEMIVWGGTLDLFNNTATNTGGRYNPGTNNWMATTTTNPPEARDGHRAVWSGSEMIVWGGFSDLAPFYLNTGGRYCAPSGSPTPTATPTATATATATPTSTPTPTPTATGTASPTPTATTPPRDTPVPRSRPTPGPRP